MTIIYPAARTVSVWIGTFPTEDDFDRSIDDSIVPKLNLPTAIESICEVSFEVESVEVRKLLEGFSGWKTFVQDAVEAARKLGLESANAALVCYFVRCEDAPTSWGQLWFLGSLAGQNVE